MDSSNTETNRQGRAKMEKIKWYTVVEIIDAETGEIITKSEYERRGLRIINKTKTVKIDENTKEYGEIKWIWECRPHEQLRLQW